MASESLSIYLTVLAAGLGIFGNFTVIYLWDLMGRKLTKDDVPRHIIGIIAIIVFLILIGIFLDVVSQFNQINTNFNQTNENYIKIIF